MTDNRKNLGYSIKHVSVADWIIFALMLIYGGFCIGSSIYFAIIGRYRDIMYSYVFLLVVPVYYLITHFGRIKIPVATTVILLIFMTGSFVGAGYNLYTKIRFLDDILHAVWGIVFTITGFALIKYFMGEPETQKQFFGSLIAAFAICLAIAVFWEIYEYSLDRFTSSYDMQEDTIVNSIHSFLLYPEYDHLHTLNIEGIAYTVLYDAEGNILYTIQGGYLDIGIIDTMNDIVWCTVAAATFCIILIVDRFTGKNLYKYLIPYSSSKNK